MKYVIGICIIVASIIIIGSLGAMMDGVKDFRTDWVTDSFVVATNTTVSNATVQLKNSLWEAQLSEAEIGSNITADTPSMTSYTDGSKSLSFDGLATNTSRLITVQYRTASLSAYPGADKASTYIPIALMITAIFLPLLAIVMILLGR